METVGLLMIFIVLIFTILIFHKGRHRYPNIILGLYLITQIIGIGSNLLFQYRDLLLPDFVHLYLTGYPVLFLWLPFYYFFIRALLNADFKIQKIHFLHFLPSIGVLLYFAITFYFKEVSIKIEMVQNPVDLQNAFILFSKIVIIQIISYNSAAIWHYLKYRKQLKNMYTSINVDSLVWLNFAILGFLVASSFVGLGMILRMYGFFESFNWFLINNTIFLLFFVILFYLTIVNPDIIQSAPSPKYAYSKYQKNELENVLIRLDEEIQTKALYKKQELTLNELSKETGINERCISQAINELKKQNFYDYINGFRVKYAQKLLKNPSFQDKTMLYILFEAGFNSKTTFNNVFKKYTGLTPSQYRDNKTELTTSFS